MSQTAEKFASIDAQLSAARAVWEKEKQEFQDRIVGLEQSLDMHKTATREAIEARIEAEKRTSTLQALFSVVTQVLNEAQKVDHPKFMVPTNFSIAESDLRPGAIHRLVGGERNAATAARPMGPAPETLAKLDEAIAKELAAQPTSPAKPEGTNNV